MLNEYVGKEIKDLREAMGFSQEKLASIIGVSRVSIVNMEAGRQAVSLEKLYKIAFALDANPRRIIPPSSLFEKDIDSAVKALQKVGISKQEAKGFIISRTINGG